MRELRLGDVVGRAEGCAVRIGVYTTYIYVWPMLHSFYSYVDYIVNDY